MVSDGRFRGHAGRIERSSRVPETKKYRPESASIISRQLPSETISATLSEHLGEAF